MERELVLCTPSHGRRHENHPISTYKQHGYGTLCGLKINTQINIIIYAKYIYIRVNVEK